MDPSSPAPAVVVHKGWYCGHCISRFGTKKEIEGTRFHCKTCEDGFDLCSSCHERGQHEHDATHVFARYDQVLHAFVSCDVCNAKQIQGPRFNCTDCGDIDLCGTCYETVETHHNRAHTWLRYDQPKPINVKLKLQPILIVGKYGISTICNFDTNKEEEHGEGKSAAANKVADGKDEVLVRQEHKRASKSAFAAVCDGCSKGIQITDTRFTCNECSSNIYCAPCYSGRVSHNNFHAFTCHDGVKRTKCPPQNTTESVSMHVDVRCDGCYISHIEGPRYSCNECHGENYCASCYNGRDKHDNDHAFTRHDRKRTQCPPQNITETVSMHVDVRCDGCYISPIEGPLYSCNECANEDYCSSCYHGRDKHDNYHAFTRHDRKHTQCPPQNITEFVPMHAGVRCDGCDISHIEGPRYSCNECDGENYCGSCYHGRDKHDNYHTFTRHDRKHTYCPPQNITEVVSMHVGVRCDGCYISHIEGPRYSCNECDGENYCGSCYHGRDKHDNNHAFTRHDRKQTHCPPQNITEIVSMHVGVQCDGCYISHIEGPRYSCNECDGENYCGSCYHGRDKHDNYHAFTRHDRKRTQCPPQNITEIVSMHVGVQCDGCYTSHIEGPRYSCNECDGENYCASCYHGRDKHDNDHAFTRHDREHTYCPPQNITEIVSMHVGVQCDGCYISHIEGPRYSCNECDGENYCASCYKKARSQHKNHTFTRYDRDGGSVCPISRKYAFRK